MAVIILKKSGKRLLVNADKICTELPAKLEKVVPAPIIGVSTREINDLRAKWLAK